ncbi:MAG: alpha/beta hydrolase [Proteobacteria bacterium]|nr:alpha/beta hydrolase [Pseudomonadota bacterium]
MKIDIGGTRLFVDVDGFALRPDGTQMTELPVIVLVHGGPGFDHTIQKAFASQLADFAQVVCFDQRGHGRSDRGEAKDWTLAQWADDIRSLCDALGIDRPIVMGSSFGGIVAQEYAVRHADHPAKLILHCTTPKFALDRIVAKFTELGGARAGEAARALWRDPGDPALLGPYSETCMPLYNTRRRDPALTRDWGIATPEVLTHFYSFGGEGHRFDFTPRLHRVACPTLVMGGEEDPICPIADSEDIVAALPSALVHFRRFARCGHGISWDDPDAFVAAIRDFVLE